LLASGLLVSQPADDDDALPSSTPAPQARPEDVATPEQLAELARSLGLERSRQAMALQPLPQPPEPEPQEWRLWSEHVAALDLFNAAGTQWRVGHSGPTGLDYAGVRASPAFRGLPRATREQTFADLCVIERGWLAEERRQAALRRAQQQQPQALGDDLPGP